MEVKIVSSSRPLQIQRSFEGSPTPVNIVVQSKSSPVSDQSNSSPIAQSHSSPVAQSNSSRAIELNSSPVVQTQPSPVVHNNNDNNSVNNAHTTTAPSIRKSEYYSEEIDSRTTVSVQRPLTPADLFDLIDYFKVFVFALLVLVVTLFCILTENDLSLAYVLTAVAILSLGAFRFLKL